MPEPVEITPLYADDELNELMAKGHVERAAFVAAANEGWGRYPGPFEIEDVEHVWRRSVPDSTGHLVCRYLDAEPGSRGAFRATIVSAWARYYREGRASPPPGAKEPR